MTTRNAKSKHPPDTPSGVPDACPHCGTELSPWEKVLLGVDRALMCRHCWYKILLTVPPAQGGEEEKPSA